jgi:hypothetical protein
VEPEQFYFCSCFRQFGQTSRSPYQLPGSAGLRIGACLALDVIALVALAGVVLRWSRRWLSVPIYTVAYAIFLAWSGSISASNDKIWAADVAHGITGVVDGDRLSVRDVRNFSWRSEADYTERWEQRTYDLTKLRSLDLFLVYWMGPSIAHTIMSFGFEDGRYLDFSVELRRTQNDQYSAVAGFFKTHELIYIGADERDLMTLRKVRNEQIQLLANPFTKAEERFNELLEDIVHEHMPHTEIEHMEEGTEPTEIPDLPVLRPVE